MALLRQFRVWAGHPSFRNMSAATSPKYTASALHSALGRAELPRQLATVNAIVQGCGGSEEDRQMWATAWHRLAMNPDSGVPIARVLRFPESTTTSGSPRPDTGEKQADDLSAPLTRAAGRSYPRH
jgi:hypothetical protein